MTATSILAYLLASAALPQSLGGEWEVLDTIHGTAHAGQSSDRTHFGAAVANAGDVDGDGVMDILVGSPSSYFSYYGGFAVCSGATGARIFEISSGFWSLGVAVANAGDLDGDGVPDFLVSNPNFLWGEGLVWAISGATFTSIHSLAGAGGYYTNQDLFGTTVAGIGDLDGDFVPDFLVGAPGSLDNRVEARSGQTGAVLYKTRGATYGLQGLGRSIAILGDIDGDGIDDFAAGANEWPAGGSVGVFSGASGVALLMIPGAAPGAPIGHVLCALPDLDGDGKRDLAIGCPYASPGGLNYVGSVFIVSSATGALIRRIDGEAAGDYFGVALASVGDVTGDGFKELAVGTYAGEIRVLSGAHGRVIGSLPCVSATTSSPSYRGIDVAAVGDQDGDGLPDLAVGSSGALPHGEVIVYSMNSFLHPDSGSLSLTGGGNVGFAIDFPASEAGHGYALLASISGVGPTPIRGLQVPLTHDSVLARMRSRRGPASLQAGAGFLDGNGDATASLGPTPLLAPVIGSTLWVAAVSVDMGTLQLRLSSTARAIRIEV